MLKEYVLESKEWMLKIFAGVMGGLEETQDDCQGRVKEERKA